MKCIKKWVLSEPLVDTIDSRDILSDTCEFHQIDLKTVEKKELDYFKNFTLNVQQRGKVFGFVTWFDCFFSHGINLIRLSTSPFRKSTHWSQSIEIENF